MPDAPAQLCGEFHDQAQLDAAISQLEGGAFQRADLRLLVPGQVPMTEADDTAPMREDDAQNLRQLGSGMAAAVAALAAAGLVVATGGAALPALAAAAVAGGGMAAAGAALGGALPHEDTPQARHAAAQVNGVVLLVHAASPALRQKAESVLRACGATRVWLANA